MAIRVQKYGGSSVASMERVHAVADRVAAVHADGDSLVVVVSAMGRTTDLLMALARAVSPTPHRRELDMLVSSGERISMALLAMAVRDRGIEAVSLTGSQAGIITSTDHGKARVIEVRPLRVVEALDEGRVVIVGGFAGVSTAKEVTTLGRGGSDTTAIALAAALDAEFCEILSDVDGVYTADPRVVTEATRIDRLAHGEILEMGLRGARVLAPAAIDYARRHGVTLHARSSFHGGRGTVITTHEPGGGGRAVAVTADPHALPTSWRGPRPELDALLEHLDAAHLGWKVLREEPHGDGLRCELILDRLNCPEAERVVTEAERRWSGHFTGRPANCTVTVVGEGIAEQPALWRKARAALSDLGVTPTRLDASPWSLSAEVPRESVDAVVRRWHDELVGTGVHSPLQSEATEAKVGGSWSVKP